MVRRVDIQNVEIANTDRIIESFLTKKTFSVKIEDKTSTTRKIEAGVPQGATGVPACHQPF